MKKGFSPIYLLILSAILLIILLVNGFLEMSRTKKGLFLLLEREGAILVQHFEKNIQETITILKEFEKFYEIPSNPPISELYLGIEESIVEYLLDIAHRIDKSDSQSSLTHSDLRSIVENTLITSIELYDLNGRLIIGWPEGFKFIGEKKFILELLNKKSSVFSNIFEKSREEKPSFFTIAIRRKFNPGIIALHIESNKAEMLFKIFSLQKAISDINLREGILYVSVQDDTLTVIGHSNFSLVGRKDEDDFLRDSLKTFKLSSRLIKNSKDEEIFEVIKSFSLNNKSMGIIRIGFSPKEINPILKRIKKNVILSILFLLILGISAIILIWINQNKQLQKLKEMQHRIQLAERLSSLGHLAAGFAHEIRNPLNAISMGIQRLRRDYHPNEEIKNREFLSFTDLILNEVRRLNEIVEQFLGLSKPFKLNLRKFSIRELLDNLINLFQEEANSKGIRIEKEFHMNLPHIEIDPERLTQALINIMKNGMEAMDSGGLLRIEAFTLREYLKIIVTDSGKGISKDQVDKVFNYYYTTKENGVGLGLPIAHRIIEAHGGHLELESKLGLGTKVTISIPIK